MRILRNLLVVLLILGAGSALALAGEIVGQATTADLTKVTITDGAKAPTA